MTQYHIVHGKDFRVFRGEPEMLSVPEAQLLYSSSACWWLSCFFLFIKSCYDLWWRGGPVETCPELRYKVVGAGAFQVE